jgi:hypothetical protein
MSQRIWFIRHCDKPNNPNDRGCSSKGIWRANQWAQYFIGRVNKPTLYTSGFRGYKNAQCPQKSERMMTTAILIKNELMGASIKTDYCIGQGSELIRKLRKETGDTIVIWEHTEIIEMLQIMGIPLVQKTAKYLKKEFGIVFLWENHRLSFDCFPEECSEIVVKTLKDFPRIPSWMTNLPLKKMPLLYFLGIVCFLGVTCFFFIFACIIHKKEQEQHQYREIV